MKQRQTGLTKELAEKIGAQAINELSTVLPAVVKREDRQKIDAFIQAYIKNKRDQYYNKTKDFSSVKQFVDLDVVIRQDSTAEMIFREILDENNIPFRFHYKIGPYWADFLIQKWLVVEVDGPHHKMQRGHDERRDRYMERMGYSVMRVPIWLLTIDPMAVVSEIQEKCERR